ncbi:isoprenylcysteine carboxyl methyltransferase family protein [Rhizobium halophytocola]|uniref:Isoprenylcysteine carboxyl methyltransferase (ICMT) family protein YpbQ n=1 Tax=Rhizobium halophytocola TaxID=735519 RepID=A0ABS4DYD3_9HYPH|nr:isoprenylcysteine carboxylmethyltransferase family protein [Rhizobium halophytocola]MBP1850702.1 isoprenylcysteine carboxyl methyltransferase (ICMT) family protein YpbQ [Rhizobium halophytocola]
MNTILSVLFVAAVIARLASVAVSKRHEKKLRAQGAVEHGALVTRLLAIAHIAYYLAAFGEGLVRETRFDAISALGLVILLGALVMLVWIVRLLGPVWTVKIMIAKDHPISRHALFRTVRHPNYVLNIVPELIGIALIFHAWWTLAAGLPVYLLVLAVRIWQEERAMKGML